MTGYTVDEILDTLDKLPAEACKPMLVTLAAEVKRLRERLAQAEETERSACLMAVLDEHLQEPDPESEGDTAYDNAIEHAADAIRARGKTNG